MLLTGCRLNEVARMEIGEADRLCRRLDHSRQANQEPPHSRRTAAILSTNDTEGRDANARMPFCFLTNQRTPVSGFSKTKRRVDAMMKDVPPWRLHDLRRTCATGMAEIAFRPTSSSCA